MKNRIRFIPKSLRPGIHIAIGKESGPRFLLQFISVQEKLFWFVCHFDSFYQVMHHCYISEKHQAWIQNRCY